MTELMVEQALKSMEVGKAQGPSGVTSDLNRGCRGNCSERAFSGL